jgi:glyoxylase I family protein
MEIEVLGIDHIYVSVSDMARSEAFYDAVMPLLGFKKNNFENEGDLHLQYYNRHFGYVLRPSHRRDARHDPLAPGLHHFCFRVESPAVVDEISKRFSEARIESSRPQLYPEYAPDYYAIFFTDPDGIQLEVTNYRAERRRRFEQWPNC